MKAVVLAGGEGTRLKPLTYKRPKPLIPVAGRPCIDYVLRSLAASGFHEIIVTTAYLSDTLIKSIGDGLNTTRPSCTVSRRTRRAPQARCGGSACSSTTRSSS